MSRHPTTIRHSLRNPVGYRRSRFVLSRRRVMLQRRLWRCSRQRRGSDPIRPDSPCNRVRLCHPKRWAETNDAFYARLSRELMSLRRFADRPRRGWQGIPSRTCSQIRRCRRAGPRTAQDTTFLSLDIFVSQGPAVGEAFTHPAVMFGDGKCFDLRVGECETCSIPVVQRRELVFETAQLRGDVAGLGAAGLFARFVQFRPRWGVVARCDLLSAPALMQRAQWLRTIRPG